MSGEQLDALGKQGIWVVILLTLAVFAQGLTGDFVRDDWPVIADNLSIGTLEALPNYFTSSVWASTQEQHSNFLYRPIFWVATWINYQLWGASPTGFHLFGLALYLINILLVQHLLLTLVFPRNALAALMGTVVFALHPVHVESVSWIAGFTDLLLGFFLLSSFILYRKHLDTGRPLLLLFSLILFGCALLSKEVAATFPALLVAHDLLFKRKLLIGRFVAFCAVLVLYFIARYHALEGETSLARFSPEQGLQAFEFFFTYVQIAFFPWPLEVYYENPDRSWGIALGAGILSAMVLAYRRFPAEHKPLLLFWVCWFVFSLAPALSLALLDNPTFAGRFLYLPSLSLAVGYGWLLSWLFSHKDSWLKAGALVFVAVFMLTSWSYTTNWRSDESFYLSAIKAEPEATSLYMSLAKHYQRTGDVAGLRRVAGYIPATTSTELKISVLETIAVELGKKGDNENSQWYFRQILELDGSYAMAWMGLGNNAWQAQQLSQALKYYLNAYEYAPANYEINYNLGLLYKTLGDTSKARFYQVEASKLRARR